MSQSSLEILNSILSDVEHRISLLAKLIVGCLSEDEWNSLIYYGALHRKQRTDFVNAFHQILDGTFTERTFGSLSPHARWLLAVYTGQPLTSDWCFGGSRYHQRVLSLLGGNYTPRGILRKIEGLLQGVQKIQRKYPQISSQVIENIAVDETFEILGRNMS